MSYVWAVASPWRLDIVDRKRLGEILVELGVLTPADVDLVLTALRRRGDFAKFGQIAKDMGLVCEEHILAALAAQMELFAQSSDMNLESLLDRLRAPVKCRPKIPVRAVRRKLPSKPA